MTSVKTKCFMHLSQDFDLELTQSKKKGKGAKENKKALRKQQMNLATNIKISNF